MDCMQPLDDRAKKNVAAWLGAINDKAMPDSESFWPQVIRPLTSRSSQLALVPSLCQPRAIEDLTRRALQPDADEGRLGPPRYLPTAW